MPWAHPFPLFARRLRWAPIVLASVAACARPGSPGPLVSCVVRPAAGQAVSDSIRVMVADSALAGHFVRQALEGPTADCAGRPRSGTGPGEPSPVRVVELAPTPDPRDALDRDEADLLVSRDPRLGQYARSRPGLRVVSLPWDLTYVLVTSSPSESPPTEDRTALARDAVSADARGAEPPFWWTTAGACVVSSRPGGPTSAITYPSGDPIARGLAQRLVALASLGAPPSWLADLVNPATRSSLRALASAGSQPAAGKVLPYPREAPARCDSARWSSAAVPLIDSRAFAVVRATVPPFEILSDASIHFLPSSAR